MAKAKASKAVRGKPVPPANYRSFVKRYPALEAAWGEIHRAGEEGPLDAKTKRLVRLAVAVGALREGAVHAGARKARAEGIPAAAVEQVVALAAATIGLPAAAAVHSWIRDSR